MPSDISATVKPGSKPEPGLAPDAAIVLGLASTAMPFAGGLEAEAERWLRVLRLYGEAGAVLQALGVSEMTLPDRQEHDGEQPHDPDGGRDTVGWVTARAVQISEERGAPLVGTIDLLMAVMHVYGTDFDHVLRAHGTDRVEVIECLKARTPHPAEP